MPDGYKNSPGKIFRGCSFFTSLSVGIEAATVFSLALGFVHGAVCGEEQLLEVCAVGGTNRDSDADEGERRILFRHLGDAFQQSVALGFGVRSVLAIGGKHDQFVSAHAAENTVFSERVAYLFGQQPQRLVARKVTVGIVHFFEIVDIDHKQGACDGSFEICPYLFCDGDFVEKARQSVRFSDLKQLVLPLLEVVDIDYFAHDRSRNPFCADVKEPNETPEILPGFGIEQPYPRFSLRGSAQKHLPEGRGVRGINIALVKVFEEGGLNEVMN